MRFYIFIERKALLSQISLGLRYIAVKYTRYLNGYNVGTKIIQYSRSIYISAKLRI